MESLSRVESPLQRESHNKISRRGWMSVSEVSVPVFNDRIEKKFQLGVRDSEVATVWRELGSILAPYGMVPVQEITSVGSLYFDNKDYDLLRYSLYNRLFLVRLRAYEF